MRLGVLPCDRDGTLRRQQIAAAIEAQPGIHKGALARAAGLSWGTVDYHLHRLVRSGRIKVLKTGGKTRFYSFPLVEADPVWELDHEARLVAKALHEFGLLGPLDLARRLGMGRRIVRNCLARLEQADLVSASAQYHVRYRLNSAAAQRLGLEVRCGINEPKFQFEFQRSANGSGLLPASPESQ